MKNSLLILLILFICVSFLFIGYNFGISKIGSFKDLIESSEEHHSPPSVVIEPGSGVETASYIIFKDDEGFVYAKNGDSGEIEFSGTDAGEVINWALGKLSSVIPYNRGTIFLKQGNYSIDAPLIVPSFVTLEGEGWGTLLRLADGADCAVIENDDQTSHGTVEVWIKNLRIDGNYAAQTSYIGTHGIEWDNSNCDNYWHTNYDVGFTLHVRNVLIEGCKNASLYASNHGATGHFYHDWAEFRVRDSQKYGIFLKTVSDSKFRGGYIGAGGTAALYMQYGASNQFTDNYFGGGQNNIYIDAGNNHLFQLNRIDHSTQHNIYLKGVARYIDFIGNRISDTDYSTGNTYSGIYLGGFSHNITIEDNTFVRGNPKYCVEEAGSTSNNLIQANNFMNYGTTGVQPRSGSNSIIRYNKGYMTENSGTATIPEGSSSIPVNHGLTDIPSIVTVTPNRDTRFWVTDKNENSFTINIPSSITGGVSFDWYAEV